MVMPGVSLRTSQLPTSGTASSLRAQTDSQVRRGTPVEYTLRPLMRQPSGVRRAVVAGRPPRAGVPSSGSTRSALIRAPSATASLATRSSKWRGQRVAC